MNLQLPPSIEAKLREEAAAAGVDFELFVVHVLSDRVAEVSESPVSPALANTEGRLAFFRNFADRHPQRTIFADDSREAIYADRGK